MVERAELLLRHWLDNHTLGAEGRLPSERSLAIELGISRAELRKALRTIESEGRLTRHVGRGTFLASRPGSEPIQPSQVDWFQSSGVAERTRPRDVFAARLAVEPVVAGLAASNATVAETGELARRAEAVASARDWDAFDRTDAEFHRALAEAAGNPVLLVLHETIAGIRHALVWGILRGRDSAYPAAGQPVTVAEHEAIVAAVTARDRDGAAAAARHHILVEATAVLGILA